METTFLRKILRRDYLRRSLPALTFVAAFGLWVGGRSERLAFLSLLAAGVAWFSDALRRDDELEELRRSRSMDACFIDSFLKSGPDIEAAVESALAGAARTLEVDRASLLLWDESSGRLWSRVGRARAVGAPRLFLKLGEGIAGDCLLTGRPCAVQETADDPRFVKGDDPVRSLVAVPLHDSRGGRLGVLCAWTAERPRAFGDNEVRLLTLFGRQLALAVETGRLIENLERQKERLDELNKLKTRLLSIASHDLRSPLQVAMSYSGVLLDKEYGPLTPSQEDFLLRIVKVVKDQAQLVENLLDIAQIDSRRLAIHRRPTDLGKVFIDVAASFDQIARVYKLRFSRRADPDLWMDGDEIRLRQLVTNLLQNAFKFTPEGGAVDVSLSAEGDKAHLTIRDTGCGIPPEELGKIFRSLYQLPVDKARDRGLGLGLAICKEIAEGQDGRIWAESEGRGKGAAFHVLLPRLPAVPRATPA